MAFPLTESATADVTTGHAGMHNDIQALLNNDVTTVSGTTYTLVAGDFGKRIECTSASPTTVTVPPNSSVAFPASATQMPTQIVVCQVGAGQVTIAAGSGVTINTRSTLVLSGQWSQVVLLKRATNTWLLSGETT